MRCKECHQYDKSLLKIEIVYASNALAKSESGSFSELLLIPKAQDAMTSVVNLAIVSFTSTVEPDNSPW